MSDAIKENPLKELLGVWEGDKGVDLAPKPDEDENNPYYETLTFEAVDIDIENAEEQELRAIRYNQIVREKANDKVSHDETGFWIWDNEKNTIMCAFSIPRGVSLLCGGGFEKLHKGETVFKVSAELNHSNWGIVQSPFMLQKAKTTSFKREVKVVNNTLSYSQETVVEIYGKEFNHKDSNTLTKVG